MISRYRSLLVLTLCCLMTAQAISAEDSPHVSVGTRSEPYDRQVERLTERDRAGTEELAKGTTAGKRRRRPSKGETTDSQKVSALSMAKVVSYTTHPGAYQNPLSISYLENTIELSDGSIWTVASYDAAATLNWLPSDVVIITPNRNWFSSYSFRITNQNTGESVASDLYLGPIDPAYGSRSTYWIVAIDYHCNEIYLNDGTVWKISLFDSGVVEQWLVNDIVMIGVNDGWFSHYNPNILINVNMMNFAAGVASY